MKKVLTSLVICLFTCVTVFAQNMTITGTVTATDDPQGIPGVFVMVKGTSNGTSTGADGQYTIQAEKGAVLVFSMLGYTTQEVTVGAASKVDVVLEAETTLLGEAVVTALGMKREKKALTYAVQDLKGESLLENRTANIGTSLSGKVAGMLVTGTISPGGSNRIVIRGESSLNNNQPLLVIDGVPYDNTQDNDSISGASYGGYDYGDGMGMLNADDIESISVLKGPSAAALYGSRGGSGVILITTKSGKNNQKPQVTFSNNTTFETVALQPDFQNEFGQGQNGVFDPNARVSWGPAMGTPVEHWRTHQMTPMKAENNNFDSFMKTGYATTTSLDVAGGTEKATYRFGVSHLQQEGVIPNNGLQKTNATARVSAEILPHLTAEAKIQFVHQIGKNRVGVGASGNNPIFALIYSPRSINLHDMKEIFDEDGNYLDWAYYNNGGKVTLSTFQNPYALCEYYGNEDITNRVTAHGNLKYAPVKWFDIKAQYGIDTYNVNKELWRREGLCTVSTDGYYSMSTRYFKEINADVLASFHFDNIGGSKVNLSANAGANLMHRTAKSTSESASGLTIPHLYTISNGKTISSSSSKSEKEIQSVYAMLHAEYNGYLFLDLTARNDWSSTLPKGNWSYFYPSASLGWVITEMIDKCGGNVPSWLTYAKLRGAYAQVGKDTDPYSLYPTMGTSQNQAGGRLVMNLPGTRPNAELKPERQDGYEIGFETRLFNGRFGFDFTWYNQTTKNQIISLATSITSGYTSRMINAGAINNKGIELIVDAVPVETKDWNWKIQFNYTKNWSKVLELAEGIDTYVLSQPMSRISVVAKVGEPFGDIYAKDVKTDDQGRVLTKGGKVQITSEEIYKGNMNPDWMGTLTSTLRWRDFDFSFLIDARIGGKMYMESMPRLEGNGQLQSTVPGRAEYYATGKGLITDGIDVDTNLPNTVELDPTSYYSQWGSARGHYVYDMTNVRMREMSLGYRFPQKWFTNSIVKGMKLSFVGNNLFFFYNAMPSVDPECSYSTGTAQGYESCSLPSTRRFGFNFNITF